ncbi:MAG: NHL repeat-containing protein [Ignavibacteriae bacterium]|nr:NHL repeat-containing protein [Ignavibacteriota bacterium]
MRTLSLSLIFLLFICTTFGQITSSIYFLDRFNTYKNGSDGTPIWSPVKGSWQVINESYFQKASDYDCASMYNVFLNESFEIEVTFKHIKGDVGAGLMFSSYQRTSTQYAQMIRFDGKSVFLLGYFSGGEFTATSSVKVDSFDVNIVHTLHLKVDRENDVYSVKLDGKFLKTNEPLVYRSGYCGLQSSAGEVQFTKFRLSRVEPGVRPFDLTWTKKFAITPNRQFIVPDEVNGIVRVLSADSNTSTIIGSPASSNGQFHQPVAVALLDKETFVVADKGSGKLHLFTFDGAWKVATGWKGKDRGTFDGLVSVAINNQRQIFTLEETNHRVQVFDESLKVLTEFGADKLRKPLDLAIEGNMVYVVNTGLSQVEKFSWDGTKATWKGFFSYGGGEGRGIAVRKGNVYLSVVNQIKHYDTSGTLLNTFSGRAINFLTPWGIVVDTSGNVYTSDFTGGRIVQMAPSISDITPQVSFKDNSTAIIEWTTQQKTLGQVLLTLGEDTIGTFKEQKPATSHKITINKLNAATTYRYHISPANWMMPLRSKFSRFFPLRTSAAPTTKQFAKLPMVTLIFTNVTDEKLLQQGDNAVPQLPAQEVERIKQQIDDGIKFYWIHSRFNFFLENEFVVVNIPFKRNQLYGTEWWYPPIDSMLETVLKQNGKEIKNYSAVLYLTCTQQFDTTLKKYMLAGKGGAFTNGVGTGKGYGISWWDVTKANHNAGNNWLMVHEYNHQLDDIFMMSGYPEYWFNHISPTIGTAADFGEHFDANRHILNIVPDEEWLDLKFTSIDTTTDSDGIPDNAPHLPLDEFRLGSDPTKLDTDGDGVSDLNETSFSNWLTEGWGETMAGTPRFPNLNHKDTDGDTITDNLDPYPCMNIKPEITNGEVKHFASIEDNKIRATVLASWDSSSLKFTVETDKSVPMKLMLDADTDGWFFGRDNFLINFTPKNDGTLESKLQIFNTTDPSQWPFMDAELAKTYSVKTSLQKIGDGYRYEIELPRNENFGLDYSLNKKIGILIGFLVPFDEDGNKRYVTIFEQNRFFDVTLR